MVPARIALVGLLLFTIVSAAVARHLLEDDVSGEDIVPIMPSMTMLTASASGEGGINRMLKPAAYLPSNAASNASIAMGFLMAPLMLQRGPMGARFKAPPLNGTTVPVELAGLPPRVQRAMGFVPLTADPPSGAPPRVSAMAKRNGIFTRG